MSDFKINSIATKQGQHGPVIAGVSTVNSTGCMKIPSGPTYYRGNRGRPRCPHRHNLVRRRRRRRRR